MRGAIANDGFPSRDGFLVELDLFIREFDQDILEVRLFLAVPSLEIASQRLVRALETILVILRLLDELRNVHAELLELLVARLVAPKSERARRRLRIMRQTHKL